MFEKINCIIHYNYIQVFYCRQLQRNKLPNSFHGSFAFPFLSVLFLSNPDYVPSLQMVSAITHAQRAPKNCGKVRKSIRQNFVGLFGNNSIWITRGENQKTSQVLFSNLNFHGNGSVSVFTMVILSDLVEVGGKVRGKGQPSRKKHILHLRKMWVT